MAKDNLDEMVRFDLAESTEVNYARYQDAIKKYPLHFLQLKQRYDHYIKTVPLYQKEQDRGGDEEKEVFDGFTQL
jgi:cytochrome c peroxidase